MQYRTRGDKKKTADGRLNKLMIDSIRNEYIGGQNGWLVSARCVDCGTMLVSNGYIGSEKWKGIDLRVRPTCDYCRHKWEAEKWNT